MVTMTIPEMNRKLDELNDFFTERARQFTTKITLHEGRFNEVDFNEFEHLLNSIKREAMDRITNFFEEKFSTRSNTYESEVSNLFKIDFQFQGWRRFS